jgi:NAD(P)-dependent dehydrogenase (short-subunit alcohol dehydrogenase family)
MWRGLSGGGTLAKIPTESSQFANNSRRPPAARPTPTLDTVPGVSGAAVVTGAARGLGLEIAKVLLGRGHEVELADVDGEEAERAAAALGERASATALDVRDDGACRLVAGNAAKRAGGLRVWVNNAGILTTGPVWEQDAATRERLFAVNAHGTINGTLAALEQMRASGRGHIINVVSLAGLATPPSEGVYAATKHAAISFTLGTLADLRADGVDEIHLSAVCPDGIWTPMLHDKLDDPAAAPSFSGKLLQPEQVAAKVGALLDHPRPVLTIPRSRGLQVRLFDALPRLASRSTRLWLADARRRQARWRKRLRSAPR